MRWIIHGPDGWAGDWTLDEGTFADLGEYQDEVEDALIEAEESGLDEASVGPYSATVARRG